MLFAHLYKINRVNINQYKNIHYIDITLNQCRFRNNIYLVLNIFIMEEAVNVIHYLNARHDWKKYLSLNEKKEKFLCIYLSLFNSINCFFFKLMLWNKQITIITQHCNCQHKTVFLRGMIPLYFHFISIWTPLYNGTIVFRLK